VCARCDHLLCYASEAVDIDGLHEHTQVNPHGYVWNFRCLSKTVGCAHSDASSSEFRWFPGCSWRAAYCGGCALHVGWEFVAADTQFHGLIIERIFETDRAHD